MKRPAETQLDPLPLANAPGITAPRFDDERTVQSARRVVPLAQIGSKPSRRFSLAVVTFLFLTIIGAAEIHSEWNRRKSSPTLNSALDSSGPLPTETAQDPLSTLRQPLRSVGQAVAVKQSGEPESKKPPSSTSGDALLNSEPFQLKSASKVVKSKTERPLRPMVSANKVTQPDVTDHIRPAERSDATDWQRPRQASKRTPADSVDEIFQIEDIFTGSRRP